MLKLERLHFENGGKRIAYDYSYDASLAKFFAKKPMFFSEYDCDVSGVPFSVAVIPFLSNFAPIAWFAGFDVQLDEADSVFLDALAAIRAELEKHHEGLSQKMSKIVAKPVVNDAQTSGSAMLFSGGVDAFASFFRHRSEHPALFTIQGADIALSDEKQWNEVRDFNENEPILSGNAKHYIKTNLLDFYNYDVNELLPERKWWGKVQHGLALIGATAPVAFQNRYEKLYIASTRSIHMEFNAWGSMPETDNLIAWAGTKAIHDAYELKRQDKVNVIADELRKIGKTTQIRVCYADLKQELNCSKCEKCVRTMFGLMIAGANPNEFGFRANETIYSQIEKLLQRGFSTKGSQFFWKEMLDELDKGRSVFVFSDRNAEMAKLESLKGLIAQKSAEPLKTVGAFQKFRHGLARKFPDLFNFYLKLRRIS